MSATLDHFTTWDDPRLWHRITELVTTPQLRLGHIHRLESTAKAASENANTGPIDVTGELNRSGIPTANAKVLASYNLEHHTLNVVIRNGGVNWKGTLTLEIHES